MTDRDVIINTVLGSCVSVCLFSDKTDLVGMNHYMLPFNMDNKKQAANNETLYGINSMRIMFKGFINRGIDIKSLKAKIYGGGNLTNATDRNNVAKNNIDFIINFLKDENIPVISSDIGGDLGREIHFFSRSKEVLVKKLPKINSEMIYEREKILDDI